MSFSKIIDAIDFDLKITKKDRHDFWHHGNDDYHSVDGIYPSTRICRIAEKFVGKSANEAFSIYCKQVPKYQQKFFWEQIVPNTIINRRYSWHTFFVDEDGNIQKNDRRWKTKKSVTYYSDDYKTELRHKVTGKKKPEYWWLWKKYSKYGKEEDYVPTVVSGYAIEFESKKDRTYKRLISDQRKRKRLADIVTEKQKPKKNIV